MNNFRRSENPTKPTTSDMTMERLFDDYKIHHKDIDACFNDAVAKQHVVAAIEAIRKADMEKLIREAQPGTHTDIEGTDDLEWRGYVKGIHDYETNLKRMAERLNNTEEGKQL